MWSSVIFLSLVLGFTLWAFKAGKTSALKSTLKGVHRSVEKAKSIRRDLPADLQRLRDKWTR